MRLLSHPTPPRKTEKAKQRQKTRRRSSSRQPTTWWRCGRQMKWSSGYSRARTLSTSLSTSSWKSGPNLSGFLRFLCEIELVYSRVRILLTLFSISAKRHIFLTSLIWNRALATVVYACTFCRPLSGSRRETAETETLQQRLRRAASPDSRIPDRSHFPPTWWWCDWDDDVVDMMIEMIMRLPWWWDS